MSGRLVVQPGTRDDYLTTCVEVVEQARATTGRVDFAISPDLLEPNRINVLETGSDQDQLDAFRGAGIGEDQGAMLVPVAVEEHWVAP